VASRRSYHRHENSRITAPDGRVARGVIERIAICAISGVNSDKRDSVQLRKEVDQIADQNIWFVLGLSGAGKSDLCKYVADRNNWFCFVIDFWKQGIQDGLDCYGLREVWDIYEKDRDAVPLIAAITNRFRAEGKSGGVFDFPSSRILNADQIQLMANRVTTFYLVGDASLCFAARSQREQRNGRHLDAEHWHQNNDELLSAVSQPLLRPYCVDVFKDGGVRKSASELFDQVSQLQRRQEI